jgi:anti-sigma factor RsiW
VVRSGQTCDRAREWSSLRLDGELSELESVLLDAHLKQCNACSVFAVAAEAVALQLRCAAPERLDQPVRLPARRTASSLRAVQLGAAAALVAAAAGLGTLFGAIGPQPHSFTVTPKLPQSAALLAVDTSPRGLPTTRQVALQQKPPGPIPRNLALADV